ncbi:hypothetical protein D5Q72_08855 [Enterococcus faecalis]|uniref:hypothetical protein n=1 Tax=Enterococcus faecalis TaxID=1351 RepID=UPI001A0D615D|nr:hypothetical protein [Enterococcus faecalis]EGO8910308.1 hypothetical protein [Enterococcus faecalis]EIX0513007.1 hypothetical protein [Enterococcus faecalis]EIY5763214.1 hypothetical protein [Enterococcus faecalis]EKZ0404436.1 hypothetical protein [Enterococcus faecalis]
MSKKAVWLSDIEFIEMHSSDWERLESEAFEPDESVQAQLNPNQQIVLDWLKEKYTVTNIEPIELFWRLRVNSIKPDYRGRPVYRSYRYMSKIGQLQVLQAFGCWAIEQEEAE